MRRPRPRLQRGGADGGCRVREGSVADGGWRLAAGGWRMLSASRERLWGWPGQHAGRREKRIWRKRHGASDVVVEERGAAVGAAVRGGRATTVHSMGARGATETGPPPISAPLPRGLDRSRTWPRVLLSRPRADCGLTLPLPSAPSACPVSSVQCPVSNTQL
ncbi:hypothetical protein P171DRAFT_165930 [Karstenula rhodostoma CBS 690.94]|uniref:Uncharacterized protein n=1 Tax=Karstenula rhodostoma CBS 690.94 TaxID=1392251 RepID=A0A9P4U5H8_9PLEO|nr:hypothetical protein P171DRAFT_165930 [Karstenula rhodostoma CBS 690.94]